MDYKGQQLSELIFYWIILLFGGVGWVLGYIRQEFWIVFQFWLVGVGISIVVSSSTTLLELLIVGRRAYVRVCVHAC
jgi:hypothetical protein